MQAILDLIAVHNRVRELEQESARGVKYQSSQNREGFAPYLINEKMEAHHTRSHQQSLYEGRIRFLLFNMFSKDGVRVMLWKEWNAKGSLLQLQFEPFHRSNQGIVAFEGPIKIAS